MASIFGYSLGLVGPDGGYDPNETHGATNSGDFVIGEDILTFMNVSNGTTLTNRSGDTWTFNHIYGNNILASDDNTAVIDGTTFNFKNNQLFLGYRYTADPSENYVHGSYMFVAHNEKGNIVTGHPTRVESSYKYLSTNDYSDGIVEYVDNKPQWSLSDITNVWMAFAVFCAREIVFEGENNDPYLPGGESGVGGGTGNFDGTGDDVGIPGLPTLSAVDTGFITLFNPSIAQLKSLSDYMWSGAFDLATFKKIFANPMDCILGLSIVPVSVPNGDLKEVSVGNIPTGVSMTVAASQYVVVDCGTLNVNEFWGAYLDYDPYTKAEIYLPYIGTHPISVDDIMGKSVHVVYHVDILSGACTAFVKCGGSVLYEFIGQCSSSIPVTGNDWTNVINGVLSVSAAIGTMVATGGATAPMAASAIASTAVNSMKSNVEKSGSMSGTGGMLAIQTPYLILTRPRQAMPASQNKFMGYPSFITSSLGSLSGYTVVEEIHLENISGTEQEISEIENLLKTGVIL